MCYIITATVPAGVDLDAIATVFSQHGRTFTPVDNSFLLGQLGSGDSYGVTTKQYCDCGTALGLLSRSSADRPVASEGQLARLRKQRWSEAKIQRWIEQKKRSRGEVPTRHYRAEIDQWIGLLTDVLALGTAPKVGLLLHWYGGSVDTEKFEITDRETVPLSEVGPEVLMGMTEDVLYGFVRYSPQRE